MADYTGRNRKRLQRNINKARKSGKLAGGDFLEARIEAYGNKRKQFVEDHFRAGKKRDAA